MHDRYVRFVITRFVIVITKVRITKNSIPSYSKFITFVSYVPSFVLSYLRPSKVRRYLRTYLRRYEGNNTVIINSFVALMLFNFSFDTSYSTTNDLSTIYVIMLP